MNELLLTPEEIVGVVSESLIMSGFIKAQLRVVAKAQLDKAEPLIRERIVNDKESLKKIAVLIAEDYGLVSGFTWDDLDDEEKDDYLESAQKILSIIKAIKE